MKKLALFSIFALGLAAVSCEDFDYPNPPAQSNEQLPIFDASGMAVSAVNPGQTVDLGALSEAGSLVSLGKIDATGNFDENLYDFTFIAEMSGAEDFSMPVAINCVTTGKTAQVSPDDLMAGFSKIFNTLDPAAKQAWVRLKVYAQNKETGLKYRANGEDAFYASQTLNLVPFDPGFTVEEKYYIIGTATNGQISTEGAILMTNGGGSPYDDPSFSALVTVTAEQAQAGYNWAVVPESTMAAGTGAILAPTVDYTGESASGSFSVQESLGNWNTIYAEGAYMITINVRPDENETMAFSYVAALENLWVIGNGCGWDFSKAQMLYTSDYLNYMGYATLGTEFKLSKSNDWDHGDFGGNADGGLINGGGNIPVETPGMYWITANIDGADEDNGMKYSLTAITTYGLIGNATEKGWDASTPMTPSEDFKTWTLTASLTAGEFKFRANDGWDLNLGGMGEGITPLEPALDLTANGSNIKVEEAGTYEIVLDFSTLPYKATFTKK